MAIGRRCGLLFGRLSMRVPTGGLVADFSEGTISVAGGGRYAALVYAVPNSALGKGVYTQNLCFLRLRGGGVPPKTDLFTTQGGCFPPYFFKSMIPGGIKKGSEVHFLSDFCHFDNLTCQNEPVKATLTPPKIALKQYLGVVRPPESVFFSLSGVVHLSLACIFLISSRYV